MAILKKTFNQMEKTALYISMAIALAMMFIITFDAMGRYLFNNPLTGAYELVEKYLMPALVFLGLNYSYKDNQQISIEVLYDRTSGIVRFILDIVKIGAMLLIMSLITYQGFHLTVEAFIDKRMDFGGVPIPLYWAYMWIPIGSGIMAVRLLIDLVKVFIRFKQR